MHIKMPYSSYKKVIAGRNRTKEEVVWDKHWYECDIPEYEGIQPALTLTKGNGHYERKADYYCVNGRVYVTLDAMYSNNRANLIISQMKVHKKTANSDDQVVSKLVRYLGTDDTGCENHYLRFWHPSIDETRLRDAVHTVISDTETDALDRIHHLFSRLILVDGVILTEIFEAPSFSSSGGLGNSWTGRNRFDHRYAASNLLCALDDLELADFKVVRNSQIGDARKYDNYNMNLCGVSIMLEVLANLGDLNDDIVNEFLAIRRSVLDFLSDKNQKKFSINDVKNVKKALFSVDDPAIFSVEYLQNLSNVFRDEDRTPYMNELFARLNIILRIMNARGESNVFQP